MDCLYGIRLLGVMLYKAATRRPCFDRKSLQEATKLMCDKCFKVDVGAVPDKKPR